MELAPDFFTYFEALAPLLDEDERLFCISSWNDHGQVTLTWGRLQGAVHSRSFKELFNFRDQRPRFQGQREVHFIFCCASECKALSAHHESPPCITLLCSAMAARCQWPQLHVQPSGASAARRALCRRLTACVSKPHCAD